ncbi:hypothetical protein MGU_11240 [Metarhizium guizhouense ARSEF 977]|uniref:DUF2306 domain-containing protein n=1 Tax=Metarhizium guizhouense (strain ARSEF 977) TaxID=1276136 RepID=A0A0B4GG00_METGA|nr:hypothetical protein MGU_11240 [Metarhizium guizhouense ARSEF 977]
MSTTKLLAQVVENPPTQLHGQNGRKSAAKKQNEGTGSINDRILLGSLAVLVLWYAPMSFTYFLGEMPSSVGDKMLHALVSREFAYGNGSGHPDDYGPGQYIVLLRNVTSMLPHSISGTLAIITGLFQFNKTFQFKYPIVHRSLGRVYGLCALIISGSSASFLLDTIPTREVFSGESFAMVLSMLSLGVLVTMALAVYAVWNGDVGSHREFMMLNYSLMLSAPFLRLCWVVLGRLWGETKWTVNLYSAVFAGPFLVAAPIFYLRRRQSRPVNETLTSSRLRLIIAASSLLSLAFLGPKLSSFDQWSHRPKADFWFTVPQWGFHAISFTLLSQAAKRRGDMRAYTAWATYQNGLISGPIFAVPTYYLCRHVFLCPEGIMGLCTFFGGWLMGLFSSHIAYVTATSTFAKGHKHSLKGE